VVCDDYGIGVSDEYCGDNDEHLGRIKVFYHEASGGKYVPRVVLLENNAHIGHIDLFHHEALGGKYALRAVLFGLEPGLICAVTLSRRSANSSTRTTS
jgi:hypothetical protein